MGTGTRREFPVEEDEAGARLDSFLRRKLGLVPPTLYKALRKGWVRVNGRRARPDRRLVAGDTVRITNYALPLPALEQPAPRSIPRPPDAVIHAARRSVRHRDEHVLISVKPAGVPVHRGSKHAYGWIEALAWAVDDHDRVPTPVGRLDRDTSGLLVLARGRLAARQLFAQLRQGRLQRVYRALVLGHMAGDAGVLDAPLAKQGPRGREQMRATADGRASRTRYRVLDRLGPATLVELELDTGRTHQIRAHLAAQSHPLLGDPRYGSAASRRLGKALGVERLFLHAGRLELAHPRTQEPLQFTAPLPDELRRALDRARGLKA